MPKAFLRAFSRMSWLTVSRQTTLCSILLSLEPADNPYSINSLQWSINGGAFEDIQSDWLSDDTATLTDGDVSASFYSVGMSQAASSRCSFPR
jgi:hypothetical protein